MREITVMIKPASGLCQMACDYCFYADLAEQGAPTNRMMTRDTARKLIGRVKESGAQRVHFAFQGGEPLLWGQEHFDDFFADVRNAGIDATYAVQTNGLWLDDEVYATLFAENDVLVGVSLDGDRALHDVARKTRDGKGTHERVTRGIEQLKKHGVRYNLLTVVSANTAKHPTQLYRYYKKLGVSHVQLIPCLPPLEKNEMRKYAPTPEALGQFLIGFYRLWREDFKDGKPPFTVREFDQALATLQGRAGHCGARGFCTPQLIVEADGSLYPCDFYVLPEYCTGNVHTHTLEQTLQSEGMQRFADEHPEAPALCRSCRFLPVCGGGCRRMRDVILSDSDCAMRALYTYMLQKERTMR
ncbi:MAG: SPASM domain-containing protein [Clostridia bacterium]|nr:SPASM domain-containing protein [Clostridia bacterium]